MPQGSAAPIANYSHLTSALLWRGPTWDCDIHAPPHCSPTGRDHFINASFNHRSDLTVLPLFSSFTICLSEGRYLWSFPPVEAPPPPPPLLGVRLGVSPKKQNLTFQDLSHGAKLTSQFLGQLSYFKVNTAS